MKKHLCQKWFKSRHLQKVILPILLLLTIISTGDVCIASAFAKASSDKQESQQDLRQPIRVRIFTLHNITAQQAKEYLGLAQIVDTVLAIPGTTAVSVTGSPEQLVYASTVIKLVDANEKFNVQFLDIAPNKPVPAAEKIEAQLGQGYSVGSLMEGPTGGTVVKAIVCLHKDKLLIITPEEQTNKITETVQSLLVSAFAEASSDKGKQAEVEPNQQSLQQTPQAQPLRQPQPIVASANDVVFVKEPLVIEPNTIGPNTIEPNIIEPNIIEPNTTQASASVRRGAPQRAGIAFEPNRPKPKTEDDMLGDFLTELAEAAKAEKEIEKPPVKPGANQPPKLSDFAKASSDKTAAEPNIQQPQLIGAKPAAARQEVVEQESAFAKASVSAKATPDESADKTPKTKIGPNQLPEPATEPDVQQVQKDIAQEVTVESQPQNEPVIHPSSAAEQQPEKGKQERTADKTEEQSSAEPKLLPPETEQAPKGQVQEELPPEANESVLREESQGQQPAAEAKEPAVPSLEIPNGDEMLELNLPEKLEIVALIDLVGKYLNLNYLYDETKVAGSVTVKVQGRLRVRELYDLLESVLKFRGFVMSRKGNLVTITPVAEALDQDPTFVEGIKPGDVIVTKVFHLQYITTAAARKLLGEMKLGPNITEIPETGTLVITEYAFRMQRIEDLLSIVDVPGPPKAFKLRVLNYTLAESLVPKIQALAEQLGTVNITVGTTAPTPAPTPRGVRPRQPPAAQPTEAAKKTGVYIDFDKRTNRILMIGLASEITAVEQIIDSLDVPQQDLRVVREYEIQYVDTDKIIEALKEFGIIVSGGAPAAPAAAPGPQAGAAAGGVSLDQPQIVKLESTNSLLVNATPEQHIQISRIISYIDREPIQAAIPYRIYRLENQEPEALAEVLNNLIEKTIKDKEGKIQQTIKYTEENISVVPDKNTFSLIVYASRKNQEWIGNLIKSLDRRRPQVLIDVSLVEITRDDDFNYDLSIVANAKSLVTGNLAVAGSQLIKTASGSNLEGGFNLTDSTGANLGAVKGFYSNDRIQALLTLIDKKSYGRVLAKPKVLVNDNEQGLIQTSERRYVSSTTNTYPVATSGQTPIPVTTQTWTPYEAKIELKITPQISEGDLLRLEIAMTREDFAETEVAAGAPPNYTTSNVNTIVTVPDGSTIILGGLTKLSQTKTANKVPLLGDIPIAGALFRSTSKTDKGNRKLYIFVKANILRPEETAGLKQLEKISRTNRIEFEKAESGFQRYEMFPGIKEEPISPEKVLEQDINEPELPKMMGRK